MPINTAKDTSEAHENASTWYDELIIYRSRIADSSSSILNLAFSADSTSVVEGATVNLT
jgi:hypothetical protein